jgi:S1-C subfamily serine protease
MAAYRVVSIFLAVAQYFLSPGAATAGFDDGFAAYQRGDYDTAFREFMPLAVAGDPTAQLGLGVMYLEGYGVPQDHAEAVRWFRLAANQGVPEAQHSLGVMYREGYGVPQDHAEAVRWFRLAANQAEAEAQLLLGLAYATGQGVPQDFVLAYMWINLGIAELSPERDRASWVEARAILVRRMAPAQLARAQEMARSWRPSVAARSEGKTPAYGGTGREAPALSPRQSLEREQAMEVQQLLADLGYDSGPVDGVVGPRTRAAIRAFQADAGSPMDGQVSDELRRALTDAASSGQSVAARSAPPPRRLEATGTGFAVSENGQLVTNHHVVAGCTDVQVRAPSQDAEPAVVVAHDQENDLALLAARVSLPAAAFRGDPAIRAGDAVVAVGFPLPGLLASEASVTTGTVSALAGIGNDARLLQVTVPVQPGNSGGPLLDLHGRVVGVVVGKLDALEVASLTGDIPQNVNFAIKAGVARSFLQANGVPGRTVLTVEEAYGEERQELSPAEIGARAKEFTVLVECWK